MCGIFLVLKMCILAVLTVAENYITTMRCMQMTTFLCDCVTLETNIKSLPSSVRQLLISRCTASSSRNSRNAYPADQERERVRGRGRVARDVVVVGGVEIALSTCISDTLVKQDMCCRHVLYT